MHPKLLEYIHNRSNMQHGMKLDSNSKSLIGMKDRVCTMNWQHTSSSRVVYKAVAVSVSFMGFLSVEDDGRVWISQIVVIRLLGSFKPLKREPSCSVVIEKDFVTSLDFHTLNITSRALLALLLSDRSIKKHSTAANARYSQIQSCATIIGNFPKGNIRLDTNLPQ
jgi:hypothetical protein